MTRAFIGIGTNLGDRAANILTAKSLMRGEGIVVERESSIAETDPVDYLDQPAFFNQIVIVNTELSAHGLLAVLLGIEARMGRVRIIDKGPRVIDLDILLYGREIIDTPDLVVPHYAIRKREFILRHLVELEPELRDPRDGMRYAELLEKNGSTGKRTTDGSGENG
jgi:2-amino-4-hydroxy-6-hydroxymethyldihydropteridine diphosphokinase